MIPGYDLRQFRHAALVTRLPAQNIHLREKSIAGPALRFSMKMVFATILDTAIQPVWNVFIQLPSKGKTGKITYKTVS